MRPTKAKIDLSALCHNLNLLQKIAGTEKEQMPCVKANAYGHGLVEITRACRELGIKRVAVACFDEAQILRYSGDTKPIVILGPELPEIVQSCIDLQIEICIGTEELARATTNISNTEGKKIGVHLAIDTGMGRFGLPTDEALQAAIKLKESAGAEIIGLSTHFPTADTDPEFTLQQLTRFKAVLDDLRSHGIAPELIHAENSPGLLRNGPPWLTLARPGLMMYGMQPFAGALEGLRAVMSLRSQLVRIVELPKGSSVGYGRDFITERPTLIGTIPIGYGDGYPWSLRNKAKVLVGGKRVPVVGRISMDQTTVDLSDVRKAKVGDEVFLFGEQQVETITAEEVAQWAGTINYEITTRIMPRVKRVYITI